MDAKWVISQLDKGVLMKDVARQLGISDSTVRTKLKKAGYIAINKHWVKGNGEQLLNNQITTEEQVKNVETTPKEQPHNNLMTSNPFSNEEIEIIREMISNFKQIDTKVEKGLYDRIGERETGNERNNIFLNTNTQNMFDDFIAEKNLTKKKSLIVELALEDFIKKYS
ncbi:transposase family protein [Staphylococcus aureus]|uniref:transposase family protein n=1 Tax=Staphylococcus aureus TaxID=1280 RepID=UPI00190A02AE|nr:transposase family protein [Staphylococcus aureus]MBK3313385.1 hypothetical protein [Staphylococcus aureus]WAI29994.1 MAG: hypothetical protein NRZ50_30760 [Bacillus paranthracis]WAI35810.1 MAG: hypothetical protein NRZ52_30710 [Bacillus paranthracis]WAI41645.1 MAG: hypothetical protein NRZ51_30770 [Bacillus paranthracis]